MKKIYLIDCPGVVYNPSESDEEKVLKGVVRVELVENPSDYIPAVLKKVKPELYLMIQRIYFSYYIYQTKKHISSFRFPKKINILRIRKMTAQRF